MEEVWDSGIKTQGKFILLGPSVSQKLERVSCATKFHLIWFLFPDTVIILFGMV